MHQKAWQGDVPGLQGQVTSAVPELSHGEKMAGISC